MKDVLALIVAVLGVLIACAVLGGIIYGLCLVLRQAQKRDRAIDEFNNRFRG